MFSQGTTVAFAPVVVGVQGIDNRTSDTSLWRSSTRDDVGGGVAASLHMLGSVVMHPVNEVGGYLQG